MKYSLVILTLPHWRQMMAILLKRFEHVMGYLDTNPYYHIVSGNVTYAYITESTTNGKSHIIFEIS